ncbi:MAG: tripartite tricarboxylate transporter substrate binding protein [Alphaproteobacteria bacterium]|nr:tripartite tricarboxylate transporter substrate binding protein [Alphaproteobacteria bacterium]MCW5740413.1 tripartite tricarboxylate transporter substrate binding protein [Alphaproteobacteria bacterium]
MGSISRRGLLVVSAAAGLPLPALAQAWPDKAVKIVVPFGPGGPADVYARVLGAALAETLKQPFVIENKPGAGAVIGTDIVAKSPPDGYTLLMMSNTHTTNETLLTNKPYALLKDLAPVTPVNSSDLLMVVHPSVEAKTLKEFLELARKQPGKLSYASSGPGTPYHMAGELFKSMSGTDILHVPHRNSGDARNSVLGGHVHMMLDAVTAMAGNVEAGKLRALGTTGKARSKVMPNLPTVGEDGVLGYEATIWLGLMAPAGTPAAVVDKLNAEIGKVIARPEISSAWAKQGAEPMTMSPAAFGTFLKDDIEKWAKVIQTAGIKAQ